MPGAKKGGNARGGQVKDGQLLDAILRTVPDGMDIVDENLRILWMNDRFLRKFGKRAIGKKCYTVYKDDKTQCLNCPLKNEINLNETKTLITGPCTGGRTFEITHTGVLFGGKKAILETFGDITKEKQADEKLRAGEEKYRGILNNANNSIMVYSAVDGGKDFVLTAFNTAAEKAEKIKKEKVLGRKLTQVFPGVVETGLFDVFRRVWRTGEPEHFPTKIYIARKMVRWRDNYVYKLASGEVIAIYKDVTKEKQAEEALRTSEKLRAGEEKYRGILNNANNSIAVYSAVDGGKDFIFTAFNPAAEKTDKIKKAKVLGRRVTKVFPGVVKFGIFDVFKRVWRTGKPEHFPAKVYKDQRISGWRDNYIYKLASGEIVAIYKDITKEKQADEKLRASEEKYRGILDNMNTGIVVYSAVEDGKEFVFTAFNPAAEKAEKIKGEKVLGRKLTQVFPGVVETGLFDVFRRVWRTGEPEHFQGKIFEGPKMVRWRDNYVYKLASGEVIAIYKDVTKEKQAEEALGTAEEKYRTIVESAADQIFIVDKNNKLISANRKTAAILGKTQAEVVGKRLSELFPKETAANFSRNCRNVFRSGMGISTEERMYAGDRELYISTFLNPVRDITGRVVAVAGIVRDITGIKGVEDALKESEEHYKSLFNNSPVPLFEEDFSEVKKYLDRLRHRGVFDLRNYFIKHPEEVVACAKTVRILDVNVATTRLFGGRAKESVLGSLAKLFVYESYRVFMEELVHLHTKKTPFKSEMVTKASGGRVINAIVEVSIAPNYESNWKRVLVSVTDITELKKVQEEVRKRNEDLERLSEAAVGMETELVELGKGVKKLEAKKGA